MSIISLADEDYILSAGNVARIGKEMVAALRTTLMILARSLRNIDNQFRSFKAVDWLIGWFSQVRFN